MTTKAKPVKNKRSKLVECVYPILMECSDIVQDDFWKQFYKDLSIGKGARGVYILNGIIQTSNKRGGFTYSISDKAPEVILQELHHLLTTYTSICSRKDVSKKKQFIKDLEDELKEYDKSKWTSIKRKNIRNMLMVNYAVYLKKEYNLDWDTAEKAYKTIVYAFETKTHTSKDIDYNEGKIDNITDIEYDADEGTIINNRSMNDYMDEETDCNVLVKMEDLFEPYIHSWVKFVKQSQL